MNIEEINKGLDEEYGFSYTRLEELHDYMVGEFMKCKDEIERLNNIINELEKWLKEHSKIDYNCREIIIHEQLALNTAYEYLQELKEKENE